MRAAIAATPRRFASYGTRPRSSHFAITLVILAINPITSIPSPIPSHQLCHHQDTLPSSITNKPTNITLKSSHALSFSHPTPSIFPFSLHLAQGHPLHIHKPVQSCLFSMYKFRVIFPLSSYTSQSNNINSLST